MGTARRSGIIASGPNSMSLSNWRTHPFSVSTPRRRRLWTVRGPKAEEIYILVHLRTSLVPLVRGQRDRLTLLGRRGTEMLIRWGSVHCGGSAANGGPKFPLRIIYGPTRLHRRVEWPLLIELVLNLNESTANAHYLGDGSMKGMPSEDVELAALSDQLSLVTGAETELATIEQILTIRTGSSGTLPRFSGVTSRPLVELGWSRYRLRSSVGPLRRNRHRRLLRVAAMREKAASSSGRVRV